MTIYNTDLATNESPPSQCIWHALYWLYLSNITKQRKGKHKKATEIKRLLFAPCAHITRRTSDQLTVPSTSNVEIVLGCSRIICWDCGHAFRSFEGSGETSRGERGFGIQTPNLETTSPKCRRSYDYLSLKTLTYSTQTVQVMTDQNEPTNKLDSSIEA